MVIFGIYIKISGVYLLACSVLGSRCSKKSMNLWMGLFIEGPKHWTSPICRRVWENFLTEWIFWLQVGRASPRKCFRSVKVMGYHHDYRSMDATAWLANDHRLVKWSSSPKWWHATYDLGNNVPIRLTILVLSKFQVIFGNVDCSPFDPFCEHQG